MCSRRTGLQVVSLGHELLLLGIDLADLRASQLLISKVANVWCNRLTIWIQSDSVCIGHYDLWSTGFALARLQRWFLWKGWDVGVGTPHDSLWFALFVWKSQWKLLVQVRVWTKLIVMSLWVRLINTVVFHNIKSKRVQLLTARLHKLVFHWFFIHKLIFQRFLFCSSQALTRICLVAKR